MTKIFEGDEAEAEFGHLTLRDPEKMRREDEAARKRILQYIEEHQGNTLALSVAMALFNRYGRN